MVKKISILICWIILLGFSSEAFCENAIYVAPNPLASRVVSPPKLIGNSQKSNADTAIGESAKSAWYSNNQSDFSQFVNSTWDVTVNLNGNDFYFQFIFQSSFKTDNYGDLYLECTIYDNYYNIYVPAIMYYTNIDGGTYLKTDKLFKLLAYYEQFNISLIWEFNVSANGYNAAGLFFTYDYSSQTYSSSSNFSGVNQASIYTFEYYLPYFSAGGSNWAGVALRNLSSINICNALIEARNEAGSILESKTIKIDVNGQTTYSISQSNAKNGWIKIKSSELLAGLCFVGVYGSQSYMADISLIDTISTRLVIPHVAQDSQWDTSILICNPNTSSISVSVTLYQPNGTLQKSTSVTIAGNGSTNVALSTLTGGTSFSSGSVVISASNYVAAFALYNNIKSGGYCYAGISAVY